MIKWQQRKHEKVTNVTIYYNQLNYVELQILKFTNSYDARIRILENDTFYYGLESETFAGAEENIKKLLDEIINKNNIDINSLQKSNEELNTIKDLFV